MAIPMAPGAVAPVKDLGNVAKPSPVTLDSDVAAFNAHLGQEGKVAQPAESVDVGGSVIDQVSDLKSSFDGSFKKVSEALTVEGDALISAADVMKAQVELMNVAVRAEITTTTTKQLSKNGEMLLKGQ